MSSFKNILKGQEVSNNPDKFPERYSWILSNKEFINLRSKFLTANNKNIIMKRYNPRVFTEQEVAMLSTILKSKVVTGMSIAIKNSN